MITVIFNKRNNDANFHKSVNVVDPFHLRLQHKLSVEQNYTFTYVQKHQSVGNASNQKKKFYFININQQNSFTVSILTN